MMGLVMEALHVRNTLTSVLTSRQLFRDEFPSTEERVNSTRYHVSWAYLFDGSENL